MSGIDQAVRNLDGVAHRTPVIASRCLSDMAGVNLHLKLENWQKTGSFKLRGAYNRLCVLSAEERMNGVVTASSGNYGQAVAWSASRLGISSVIVMPENAAVAKLDATRASGAQVLLCGTGSEERKAVADQIARDSGRVFVSPFDDPYLICGQGTVAREILADLADVDTIVAPVGGGGLISGIALATKLLRPEVRVIGVEPIDGNCMSRSLAAGVITSMDFVCTVADGLRVSAPGRLNFDICQRYLDDLITVSDEEIIEAMKLLLSRVKILAEPSGAVSVAGVLSGIPGKAESVVAVISGGNVDLSRLAELVVGDGESS